MSVLCAHCGKTTSHRTARKTGWVMVVIANLLREESSEGIGVRYVCSADCLEPAAQNWYSELTKEAS